MAAWPALVNRATPAPVAAFWLSTTPTSAYPLIAREQTMTRIMERTDMEVTWGFRRVQERLGSSDMKVNYGNEEKGIYSE